MTGATKGLWIMRKFTHDDATAMMVLSLSLLSVLIFALCAAAYL
jgi:hypothetical protein